MSKALHDAPPVISHKRHPRQAHHQQQQFFPLQQRDPRLSPLLLPALRRLCRQLRFLTLHPHLLAAVRPPAEAARKSPERKNNIRWKGAPREDGHAQSHRARQQAVLLLQKVWGGATHFSPSITLAAFRAERRAGVATSEPAAATPTAATTTEAAGPPASLPQLLTRIATHFVREAMQQQLLQVEATAGSPAAPKTTAEVQTAAARPPSAAPEAGAAKEDREILSDALLAASRWLSELQHQPLRIVALRTARRLLATLRTLEDLEAALERHVVTPLSAAFVVAAPDSALAAAAAAPAAAAPAAAAALDKEQLQQFQKDLLLTLQAERVRALREGHSCLQALLNTGEKRGVPGGPPTAGEGPSMARMASRAELHKAANGLLTRRPHSLQQQQHPQLQQQQYRLTGAFRPVAIEHCTKRPACATSYNSGSSSSSSKMTNNTSSSSGCNTGGLVPGLLLVAHPFLSDAFWRESVLLVTGSSPNNVEGLMLNRSSNGNSKPLQRAFAGPPPPLHLLASWQKQQQQQEQQEQGNNNKASCTGRWTALLRENPMLLLLLRESQAAAAAHLPLMRARSYMQQQSQQLQRALVRTLARRALQTVPACTRSGSSSREGDCRSRSVDGLGNCYSLRVCPAEAADAYPLQELLTSSFPPGRMRREWPPNRVQQQQQHQLQLIQWLSSDLTDTPAEAASEREQQKKNRLLLQQLVHQLQEQQQLLQRSSNMNGNETQVPMSCAVRLGGPCEGFMKVTAIPACAKDSAFLPALKPEEARAYTATENGSTVSSNGDFSESCMQSCGNGLPSEALFLGRVVWERKQFRRELQDGFWLPLECTDMRVLHQLVFGRCNACNPFEKQPQKYVDRRFSPLCPQCDGREVYRQLLASVDAGPSRFFQIASWVPPLVGQELQQAADAAWGHTNQSATSALDDLIDLVQQMPKGCEGRED